MKVFTPEDVRSLLLHTIKCAGGQTEWARQTGIVRTQITMVLTGQRLPTGRICRALGLDWVIVREIAKGDDKPGLVEIEYSAFLTMLFKEIRKAGSISALSRQMGINRSYLHEVIRKRRFPSIKMLAALNLSQALVQAGKQPGGPRKGQHSRW